MAWFFGSSLCAIGFVMALAWGWAGQRQPDSYDDTRISELFDDITIEIRQP